MTLKSIILGGTAAAALMCAGLATPSFAQQQPAPTDQSAPAAAPTATPDTSPASTDTMTSKPKHHARHHHHKMHSARMEKGSEYAETRRLNQEQLAKAQGGAQGSYGTMEQNQQQAPAAVPPSNSPPPSNMNNPPPSDTNAPPPSAPNPPPAPPKSGPY
jgi:hypothetical protein